jgi:hypothetical protein
MKLMVVAGCSVVVAVAGCGGGDSGPDLIEVYGVVTLDGEPLPDATVRFVPEEMAGNNMRAATGETDDDGEYTLEYSLNRSGALPGKYKVAISTFRETDVGEDGLDVPGKPERVPVVYNGETTLSAEVSAENAVHNFDLKSDAGEVVQVTGGEDFGSDDE